ncbi:hypothetical protein HCN44_004968 [Aphidius gifuensis]|uniref:Peptidase S1 domain-containing protein n=1 Tax=Aphidius gifuensis TaxID=684658 RepID=A0A835CQ81_APHGI|nr:hypothetical protein HCN44_004968 [Aphidius gifuensis]
MNIFQFTLFLFTIILCNGKKTNKIIRGVIKPIEDYPHIVSIKNNNHHVCSGNLVSSLHVLTAASCVVFDAGHVIVSNVIIIAGTNDKLNTLNNGQIRNVKYVVYHEKYNHQQLWNNDVAILKLEKPVYFNNYVNKITLSTYFETQHNSLVTHFDTVGWGDNPTAINYLQHIQLKKIDKISCVKLFAINLINLHQSCAKVMWPSQAVTMVIIII